MTASEPSKKPMTGQPFGTLERPTSPALGGAETVAILLGALWALGVLAAFLLVPSEGEGSGDWGDWVLNALAVFLPLALLWVGAVVLRSVRIIQGETQRLQAAVDGLRHSYLTHAQQASAVAEPSVAKKLEEIAEATRKTESALATFQSSRRTAPRPAIPAEAAQMAAADQGTLALGTPSEEISPPLAMDQFIRALNFPETAEDEEGFSALRAALKDRKAAQVIQAAQDVLTLLSQDGIYMDDLRPDMARPEIWRQFAQGARGRAVAALGGIRDRTSLALTAARMKQDPIFRDAAHHFLRRFDQMFAEFETEASDSEISALGDTRTARAFMLVGRVAGTFD
ncbi:hypothetical protein [Phaeobacter sp. F10]|uniref:hypothetical protein n=1 Tax=Phycobacter azelaicus TaxID=2668075 RepID=UPI00186854D4